MDGLLKTGSVRINKGLLTGSGTIADVYPILRPEVTLSPGNPFGTLTMVPRDSYGYLDCNRCSVDIELAGPSKNDRLLVQGDLLLSGAVVNVTLREGFIPKSGDSFEIISANNISGTPNIINLQKLPTLPAGLSWSADYTLTAVTLRVK
ncbi:MAG: hypothetical protein LUQ11_03785 [Methylococcaceae bacterium]|nr:hypothetical protein [Methylococcaceae bacterium]